MAKRRKKPVLDESDLIVTEGSTADNKYSLTIQNFGGKWCLCVHKCDLVDGLHYSTMNRKSLVTAIGLDTLRRTVREIESRPYMLEAEKR